MIATAKTIKEVAVAYGVGPETLRNWLITYRKADGGAEDELSLPKRARLKELERVVADLRAETTFRESVDPNQREMLKKNGLAAAL